MNENCKVGLVGIYLVVLEVKRNHNRNIFWRRYKEKEKWVWVADSEVWLWLCDQRNVIRMMSSARYHPHSVLCSSGFMMCEMLQ